MLDELQEQPQQVERTSIVAADWSPPACPVITTLLDTEKPPNQLPPSPTQLSLTSRRQAAHHDHPDQRPSIEPLEIWIRCPHTRHDLLLCQLCAKLARRKIRTAHGKDDRGEEEEARGLRDDVELPVPSAFVLERALG